MWCFSLVLLRTKSMTCCQRLDFLWQIKRRNVSKVTQSKTFICHPQSKFCSQNSYSHKCWGRYNCRTPSYILTGHWLMMILVYYTLELTFTGSDNSFNLKHCFHQTLLLMSGNAIAQKEVWLIKGSQIIILLSRATPAIYYCTYRKTIHRVKIWASEVQISGLYVSN